LKYSNKEPDLKTAAIQILTVANIIRKKYPKLSLVAALVFIVVSTNIFAPQKPIKTLEQVPTIAAKETEIKADVLKFDYDNILRVTTNCLNYYQSINDTVSVSYCNSAATQNIKAYLSEDLNRILDPNFEVETPEQANNRNMLKMQR